MTKNTQFKTLLNTWLNQKKPMITPSTHASFTLIAENHLIPYFGKRKIGSITEADIQSYITYLHNSGRLDNTGGLTVKTIRDVILVLRLAMEYAYKERAIPLLNWDLIEYPKELGVKKVNSLSKDQEQTLIQCIYMDLNRKTAGILIALFTGVRIGELCGLQMKDISLTDKTININKTVQRIYDKRKQSYYLHIGPPKTNTSARTIPVPSLLMNIIKKFYTENPNHYFLTGKTKPTEPRTYRQFFARFLKRNGLQKVKFHEIRHTFAVPQRRNFPESRQILQYSLTALPDFWHKSYDRQYRKCQTPDACRADPCWPPRGWRSCRHPSNSPQSGRHTICDPHSEWRG